MVLNPATDQPWVGDDQQWWDWYVTTARNDADRPALRAGPVPSDEVPADPEAVAAALAAPYRLTARQIADFARDGCVKLPDVIPPDVVAALAVRLDELLATHFGGDTDGRFLSLEMMWRTDSLMRLAALSPRLGGIAATLLDEPAVRLYHDNALSKQPGCGRTPWHHDADHFPLDSTRVCTSWLPLHPVPVSMGPLAFAPGVAPSALGELPSERDGTAYDIAVAAWLDAHGARIAADPFALGDVSFHASSCLHTAGANHTTAPRRVLSNTYMADGARVIARPTALSGAWQDFMPGVGPGDLAASACNPVVGRSQ